MFGLLPVLAFWVPLGLMLYNWILFPLLLAALIKLRTRKTENVLEDTQLPSVTVVIAAHNESAVIARKLENCLDIDYPRDRLDVLVVSDGSDDGTDEVAREFRDPRVRLIRQEPRRGKAAALNLGIGEAKGDLVLFTDADVIVAPDALRQMAARFNESSVGAVHAHYHRLNKEGSPAEGIFDRYEAVVKELEGKLGAMVGAYGWALMLRRSLCTELPVDTILDDFVLGIQPFRSGFDVVYEPHALCWTEVEKERIEFWRKVRISRGNVQALFRCFDLFHPRYGVKAWVLFSHKFLRWITPFLLLLVLVGSVLEVARPFFRVLLLVQALCYATMPLLPFARGRLRKLLVPQYYLFLNLALLVGYWQCIFGRRSVYWQRTVRRRE